MTDERKRKAGMDNKTCLTLEQFIARALELRALADEAKERLMVFLFEVETDREVWAATGRSFEEILKSSNICEPTSYIAWKRVRESLGSEAVSGVGVHAVIAAGSLKTKTEQQEVIDRARKWESSNGTRISEQSAERIAREAKLVDMGRHRSKGYLELVRENDVLRAKLRTAEQTILALRSELRAVKSRMAKTVKGNRATTKVA